MKKTNEEIELKLAMDKASVEALRTLKAPAGFTASRGVTQNLQSIYFDAPDQVLRGSKWSLRLRKVGRQWLQTVKAGTGLAGGLSNPREVEDPAPGGELAFDKISDAAFRDELIAKLGDQKVARVFETRIRRTTKIYRDEAGSEIEVAFDIGEVLAGERSAPLSEVELELKKGSIRALYALAKALLGETPVAFSQKSKAQQGYDLADLDPDCDPVEAGAPAAKYAERVVLKGQDTSELAFRAILRSCLDQIAHNRIVVLRNEGPEGVHQMRVGLRRLRSALKIYAPIVEGTKTAEIDAGARALAQALGELRDLDVLGAEIVAPLAEVMPEALAPEDLLLELSNHREDVRDNLRVQLSSSETNAFIFDLGAYTEGRGWIAPEAFQQTELLARPVEFFAVEALEKRWRHTAKFGKRIGELTVPERHEMRKTLKKLRYAVEFFQALFEEKEAKQFLRKLKKLQNVFGYLNDVAMAEKLTQLPLARNKQAPEISHTCGFVIGWHEAQSQLAWESALVVWESAAAAKKFWRR